MWLSSHTYQQLSYELSGKTWSILTFLIYGVVLFPRFLSYFFMRIHRGGSFNNFCFRSFNRDGSGRCRLLQVRVLLHSANIALCFLFKRNIYTVYTCFGVDVTADCRCCGSLASAALTS